MQHTTDFYRQGDVGFLAIESLPAATGEQTSTILVEGEVTGHAHRVETPTDVRVLTAQETLYLSVLRSTRIVHEEHAAITLPPGNYRIVRQREYAPDAIRTVMD